MLNRRRSVSILTLAVLVLPSTTLWADRDGDERKFQREQPRPQRPEVQNGRVEIKERPQQMPAPVQRPAPLPAQRIEVREPRKEIEKVRPPVQGRPVTPVAPPTATPAPKPIKDWRQESRPPREAPKPGWVLDNKYKHNHYYPPRGHIEHTLPHGHRVITHNHTHYHYYHGIWYRPHGAHFVVVLPPVGLFVPVLPPYFTTVWVNSTTYYYAGGVYYSWWAPSRQYVVVEAPPETKVRTLPDSDSEPLYIYPAAGQSEEQQARDRYECHRWAQGETGFDPSAPGGGVPAEQHTSKRSDYYRAMKACLEARHYSVQ